MGVPLQMLEFETHGSPPHFPEVSDSATDAALVRADWDLRFAEMAERHARFMFRVAHGLLRNIPDAEDAVQEALLKLYRGEGWRAIDDEKAFLARTVWRAGLDVQARRPRATEPLDDDAGREFAAAGDSAEQRLVDHGDRELLQRLIDGLPEDLRQPLVLSAVEEMTSREVAIAMGIPEGTVRTRIMRARTQLKQRFETMRRAHAQSGKTNPGETR